MDYFNKNFSKRERILFAIFAILLLELVIYFIFISPRLRELNESKDRLSSLKMKVEDDRRELLRIEKLKEEVETLKKEKEGSFINSLNPKNYEGFKKSFPKLEKYDNRDDRLEISFKLDRTEVDSILKFSKYYIFDEMTIKREKEHSYNIDAIVKLSKGKREEVKVVKKDEKIDKNLNLSREYFLKRTDIVNKKGVLLNSKDKKDKDKIENIEKIEELKKQEIQKQENLVDKELAEGENPVENEKEIILDSKNFSIYYPENSLANLNIFEENKDALVYYKINKESIYKEILILFNDVFDFSNLKFDLIVGKEFKGEFGIVTTDKTPIEQEIKFNEINNIEFKEIKNVKGIYYKTDSDWEEGVFSISNLRGVE